MKRSLLLLFALSGLMLGGCAVDSIGNVQWNSSSHLNTDNPPKGLMGAAQVAPTATAIALQAPAKPTSI